MAYFASPFYQGLVSLDHSCRPTPVESTYTASYRSMIERVHFMKLEAERAKEAATAKIEQRKKAAQFRIACPLLSSIYQSDFTKPDDKLALAARYRENDKTTDQQNVDEKNVKNKMNYKKCKEDDKEILEEHEKIALKKHKYQKIPEWKIIGWRNKKACWIRPIEERKQYKPEHIVYPFSRPCKRC